MNRSPRKRTASTTQSVRGTRGITSRGSRSISSSLSMLSSVGSSTSSMPNTRMASSRVNITSPPSTRGYFSNSSAFTPTKLLLANPKAKKAKKSTGADDEEEDAFAGAGEVKKRIKNWMEKILTTKPQPLELPEVAKKDEAQFVKECQARFAARLDRRSRHEMAKITIKQRAIQALPAELREEALKEDNSLWSMQIISPTTFPPRKKWLMEHYQIPYTPSSEEIEAEEAQKKHYARFV